ncbi:O-antigen ligase family protein [Leptolyngbya sp. CCNP1308]|uniref:O-antigen ligase family protein n=1 Tax=Leptolyngbya sp. CCNP1308 TaxID=3110255 RepID=UPI002B1EEB01|nr:O-antigen ligase family protein [Leptolyngbya sp. CCNP1308]MEA5451565.1 O-antigen ligase family protein [Leptolyngbya sp. CCNP1308]
MRFNSASSLRSPRLFYPLLASPMAQDISSQQPAAFKGGWLGGIGLVAVVVMTWLPHSYMRMVGWPWALVWQLGFLAFGGWLIWLLRQFELPFRPLGYGLDWAVTGTGASLIICSLASDFKTVALWNVILATGYFFALYCGINWFNQAQVNTTQVAAAIATTMLGTALISLVLWRPETGAELGDSFSTALRNAMPFGHHNFVGGYFALALPFVAACAVAFKGSLRWLAVAASALTAIALYVSGSRGALLGILVWLLVTVIAFVLNPSAKGRTQRWLLGGLGLAVAIGVLASNSRVRSLFTSLDFNHPSGFVVQDGPLLDRYFMAQRALNILRDRPLVGIGPGVMSRVSNLYRPIETGLGSDHSQQLHSTPVQLLGEMGLLGLGLYLLWLVLLTVLWLRLYRTLTDPTDRWLLYGVGGGLLAYAVSSLTDYQLENIGISAALVALLALLISLARRTELPSPPTLAGGARRYFSLALVAWLAIASYVWFVADLGFLFAHRALGRAEQGDVAGSLQQLSAAAAFVPWDPTYPALAGQNIYQLLPLVPPAEQEAVRRDALVNFYSAAAIAPNDAWFNYNLAVLLLPQDPAAAQVYSQRAVQLLPRNRSLSRYLLGQTYLAQGQTDAAITAFSLEGLSQPEFLTLPLWRQAPLAPLQDPVVDQALAHHQSVLEAISPDTPGYATLYDQTALVRWWYQRPILIAEPGKLRPITQALLATDQNAEAALAIVNQALEATPQDQALLLLRAWLAPATFAQTYFAQADLPAPERALLAESLGQFRDARSWLTAMVKPTELTGRSLLGLTYRNRYAQAINLIAPLEGLEQWMISDLLGLFTELPREFVALDQTVEAIQTEQLNLPSAANNRFEILPPSPLPEKLF